MADEPTFYLYPVDSGPLVKIALEGLSVLTEEWPAELEDAYGGDGLGYRSFLGASSRVHIMLERYGPIDSSQTERDMINIWRHLQRGGLVGFSRNHAKSWASICSSRPTQGDNVLYTSGNG